MHFSKSMHTVFLLGVILVEKYLKVIKNINLGRCLCRVVKDRHLARKRLQRHGSGFLVSKSSSQISKYLKTFHNIAFARGGAHLPIAHALRLLSTQELRFGLTKLKLRKNNFLK